ncbi:MAG: NADH-quinone oxidoreductase subunit C [Planctomycetes bacterium]|nr:NADH-quinone oxidoreductase subunit C [Planctomycetota bacterium]
MNAAELQQALAGAFGDRIVAAERSPRRLYVMTAPAELLAVFDWLLAHLPGLRLATSTAIDLRDGVGVFHHFAINGSPLLVTVKVVAAKPAPVVPSLTPRIPAANWIEREMHDLVGVDFAGHPDPRRLVKAAAFPDVFPLRRDFDPEAFKESIGERLEY